MTCNHFAGECAAGAAAPMMQVMLTEMMPHCLKMMLPQMPQEARTEFVLKMIGTFLEQGIADLTREEKNDMSVGVKEKLEAIFGPPPAA